MAEHWYSTRPPGQPDSAIAYNEHGCSVGPVARLDTGGPCQVPHGESRGLVQASPDLTRLSQGRKAIGLRYRRIHRHRGMAPQPHALRPVVKQAHGVAASAAGTQTAGYLCRGEPHLGNQGALTGKVSPFLPKTASRRGQRPESRKERRRFLPSPEGRVSAPYRR
jgi:hypothetical protein